MNGWVALARACAKSERTPLEKMIDLGVRLQTSRYVPPGTVYVMNPDAIRVYVINPDAIRGLFNIPTSI